MLVRQPAASRTHASLSLEGLPAGLYLLRIESEGYSRTYRFLLRARK
ncbi:MAG: T9SS type A sorting domain-containing protein [Bacteroidaceae bacterium]|nr:T9SS type A sorting domain-containing protein [Prevotellaceae bacterium]MDD7658413.1 T9SS type A sorting domain-containing protein [Prevotellaceae bacterium]MDY5599608.1 T9SS type A sorting domain-containing protein [Bacteroidaceae bacterium]MEE1242083.1 T9SS type A sorting domain-containing protein [Bacteroidaceae bacterium]